MRGLFLLVVIGGIGLFAAPVVSAHQISLADVGLEDTCWSDVTASPGNHPLVDFTSPDNVSPFAIGGTIKIVAKNADPLSDDPFFWEGRCEFLYFLSPQENDGVRLMNSCHLPFVSSGNPPVRAHISNNSVEKKIIVWGNSETSTSVEWSVCINGKTDFSHIVEFYKNPKPPLDPQNQNTESSGGK